METNLYYDVMVEVHSNQCDTHKRVEASNLTENEVLQWLPDGISLEVAMSEGWIEESEDDCGEGYWWYKYTVELSDEDDEGDEE